MNKETTQVEITEINLPRSRSDWRRAPLSFVLYTDGSARAFADQEYFTKHEIYNLKFKCRSWGRVGGFAARIEAKKAAAAIEQKFGVKVELQYSRKAGCSCGCSPGFKGKMVEGFSKEISRADIFVDVPITKEEEAEIVQYAAAQAEGLPAEIATSNAQVKEERKRKAEQACREEERKQRREWLRLGLIRMVANDA